MSATIGSLIARDLDKRIEEIIKVDQADEQSVYTELTEYVATDRLREHYRTLLKAIAEAPGEPHEGIGVWVSGFFGSGKSSFAKNLGYDNDGDTLGVERFMHDYYLHARRIHRMSRRLIARCQETLSRRGSAGRRQRLRCCGRARRARSSRHCR